MLTGYFNLYFANLGFGPGYIITSIILALGSAALFQKRSGLSRLPVTAGILWAAGILFDSLYYALFSDVMMDDFQLLFILILSAILYNGWSVRTKILRCSVFFGCMKLALPISEPFGDTIKAINPNLTWSGAVTPLIMAVLCAATVIFLRKFSTENFSALPSALTLVIVTVSLMAWVVWRMCRYFETGRTFSFILSVLLWVQIWLFYYVFYIAGSQIQRNTELQAMQQKEQLDQELLALTRQTYDDLHKTRHELKNHLIYMKLLAYREEWDKLWNYLNELGAQTEEMFTYVECGNEVVNAVLNHAVGKARQQGLQFETNLIVPPKLPFDEVDLCSLLSNLANNAIEAAAQVKDAAILFSIYPQQDYLFIKVQNPFDASVSGERRLSLVTTKKDKKYHGYGTRVIRQIAEKYGGSASFSIEKNQFIATVMLDLQEGH